MGDLLVRIKAEDGLSGAIEKCKKALEELGQPLTTLERINKKFKEITDSSAPLNRKLKETQKLIAEMNFEGLKDEGLYTELINQAGAYRDAIADAQAAVNAFASDHSNLDAAIMGLQGLAAAGSIASGAMGLLGVENENAQKALLKVQSAIAILNGVQSLSNVLNSNSVLILKMKSLAQVGSTITLSSFTAALKANSIAEAFNGLKTKISTGFQTAWNVAKAIGMALLGNFTGLLILGAGAVIGMTMALRDDTDETEKNNEAKKNLKTTEERLAESRSEAQKQLNSSVGKTVALYQGLKHQWDSLTSSVEKSKWLETSKSKFDELGVSVSNLADAEKFFNSQTGAVLEALIKRAKAAATYDLYVKALQEQYELNQKQMIHFNWSYTGPVGGDDYNKKKEAAWQKELQDLQNKRQAANQRVKDLEQQLVDAEAEASKAAASLDSFKPQQKPTTSTSKKDEPEKGSLKALEAERDKYKEILKTKKLTDEQVAGYKELIATLEEQIKLEKERTELLGYETGSLADLQAQLSEYENNLKNKVYPADELKTIIEERNALEEKIRLKKVELGLEEPNPEPGSLAALRAELSRLEAKRNSKKLSDEELKNLDEQIKKINQLIKAETSRSSGVQTGSSRDISDQLSEARALLEVTATESPEFKTLSDKIKELTERQYIIDIAMSNGITEEEARQVYEFKKNLEEMQKRAEEWSATASSMGSAFQSLGGAIGGAGGEMLGFAGSVLQAVSQIIPQMVKLIAANQAAAIAEGVESGAKLMFPANLAAIATIVASIMSIFASLPKFASGGVIGGSSLHGDTLLARVNSGEMILNGLQQANLFRMLNSGATDGRALKVDWRLRGEDLVGAISNYNKKTSKFS